MKRWTAALLMGLFLVVVVSPVRSAEGTLREKQGPSMGAGQKICPVSGKPVHLRYFSDYKGFRVYFHSRRSLKRFRKNPDRYMRRLKGQQQPLAQAPVREERPRTSELAPRED